MLLVEVLDDAGTAVNYSQAHCSEESQQQDGGEEADNTNQCHQAQNGKYGANHLEARKGAIYFGVLCHFIFLVIDRLILLYDYDLIKILWVRIRKFRDHNVHHFTGDSFTLGQAFGGILLTQNNINGFSDDYRPFDVMGRHH